ncbi:MAG: DNA-3-methyladenine glycosylase 2 family protein [Actinobacteria bacterium]|nr:DNA-3-methyladenine glycosylase 2 family protein [Actinomycetota bacterium]
MRVDARRMVRACRVPNGPVTMEVSIEGGVVGAAAWGPGAEQALDELPELLGTADDPDALRPRHRAIADLHRRFTGLRIGRTRSVTEAVIPAVLEQKVTGNEAWRVFRNLVRRFGDPSPGPHRLWLLPPPQRLTATPYFDFHAVGLERKRAEVIREVARLSHRLDRVDIESASRSLRSIPGVGAWTIAEVRARAFGDADAVSVGDYHLPKLVCWTLAGEREGGDDRMLELLEPYRGQRGRVLRLLELGGLRPPRRGPRMRSRALERI